MRIQIRQSASWPPETAALAERRLEFALGRFTSRVRTVLVRLSDLNGPKGGVDKKCLIAVQLNRPARAVIVEDVDTEGAAAISRAADRVSRAVSRAIGTGDAWAPRRR